MDSTEIGELSGAAKGLLALFGVSFAAFSLYIVSLVVRAVLGLLGRRSQSPQQAKQSDKSLAGKRGAKQGAPPPSSGNAEQQKGGRSRGPDLKTLIKQSEKAKKSIATKEDMAAHHALFITTLKGHSDTINGVAWSPDGRLLATACSDMYVRLFDVHDLSNTKDPKFRFIKTNYPPLAVGFGNEGNDIIAALRGIPDLVHLVQYHPQKSKAHEAPQWVPQWQKEQALGKETLLDMVVVPASQAAAKAGVAVLLSTKKEGRVFSLANGAQLGVFEPNSLTNHGLTVSGNGRFVAVASFTADVKVWEVEFGRDGFKGVPKAMDLKGHNSQVMAVAFNGDGSRAVTTSKDGTMRFWNTAVRYALREDPKTLLKVPMPLPSGQMYDRLAWGPDGTIAAAYGMHIHFIDGTTGKVLENLHAHERAITGLAWAPQLLAVGKGPKVAVLASCSEDNRVRIWKSPADVEDE